MSMWEIEALVEDSIRVVDASEHTEVQKRDLVRKLYWVQGKFDCSFTQFRLMPILLELDFVRKIDLEEHPQFDEEPVYFEELRQTSQEWVWLDVKETNGHGSVAGYWVGEDEKLYVDMESPLYGDEVDDLDDISVEALGLSVIRMADEQEKSGLIYHWVAFLLNYAGQYFDSEGSLQSLVEDYYGEIKTIFNKYDFSEHEPMHRGLTVLEQAPGWLDEMAVELIEWFHS